MITPQGNVVVGKKGRSGRKSARAELPKTEAIRKAWLKVVAELDAGKVTDIALPIALKDMTEKKDVSGTLIIQFDPVFNDIASEAKKDNPEPSEVQSG